MPGAEFWNGLKDWNSPQLVLAFCVVAMLLLFGAARFFLVGGKPKFDANQADKQTAIGILTAQINDLKASVERLEQEMEQMREAEEFNREYRHALANQNNILLASYEVITELIRDMASSWNEIPLHFKERVARLKGPRELLENTPLPKSRRSIERGG